MRTSCQDMIFLNLYFDQFYAHLMDILPYDSYDFMTYEQEQIYCGGVRICDPTTQSRSRAEPDSPVCVPSLSLLRFRTASAPLPDLSPLSPLSLLSPLFT